MTPKLVIFDCDGVLVDSEPPVTSLLSQYFGDHGLEIEARHVHSLFVGGTLRGAGEEARRRGAVLPEDWFQIFSAKMFDELRKGVPLIEGVVPLLDHVERAGISKAIVSNGAMEKMEITLGPWGLLPRFDGMVFSSHVHGAPKPSPEMVVMAMALAGAGPDETVMIDDSPAGCKSGIAAGVRTFGYAAEGQDAALRSVGAEVINEMRAIAPLIGL